MTYSEYISPVHHLTLLLDKRNNKYKRLCNQSRVSATSLPAHCHLLCQTSAWGTPAPRPSPPSHPQPPSRPRGPLKDHALRLQPKSTRLTQPTTFSVPGVPPPPPSEHPHNLSLGRSSNNTWPKQPRAASPC